MNTEIEAKWLAIDAERIRVKLREIGAVTVAPKRMMTRKNFDYPDGRLERIGGWVRLRDEGNKMTLSYKQLHDRTLHGTKEVNVIVGDFAATESFLIAIGLEQKSVQQTSRESWLLGDVEIELDEWPWIKPFMEIEAKTEHALLSTAEKLGLDMQNALHGSVEVAYQAEYDVTE